tara:strand:+ start:345 stop:896 length:552 start_codon:yes stop_codon:yes gene_type:complete
MEKREPSNKIDSSNKDQKAESKTEHVKESSTAEINNSKLSAKPVNDAPDKPVKAPPPKKAVKPPKLEDKPFEEFINKHLIPGLKSSIEDKGELVKDIKLIQGERPVVGGNCWMIFCQFSEQRRFWLCFKNESITSDKTILIADSNSEPSIVESFLIDEKKTTLPLLISRVLQRLNGQKWIGVN